jgi:uncharacterized small protein (DUF1192 family)
VSSPTKDKHCEDLQTACRGCLYEEIERLKADLAKYDDACPYDFDDEKCMAHQHQAQKEIERLKADAKEEVAGLSFYEELLSEHRRALKVVEAAREALDECAQLSDKVEYRKPTHGTCCTCQGCGQPNEHPSECRCASNKLHEALAELEGGGGE